MIGYSNSSEMLKTFQMKHIVTSTFQFGLEFLITGHNWLNYTQRCLHSKWIMDWLQCLISCTKLSAKGLLFPNFKHLIETVELLEGLYTLYLDFYFLFFCKMLNVIQISIS